jgi:hypothetical protein
VFAGIIEITSLLLFIGCFIHSARYCGREFAQQWFLAGYLSAILRETIMQVAFGVYLFAAEILRIGAAPALLTLLSPSLFYIAVNFSSRFVTTIDLRKMLGLIFVICSSLALPIEATAAQTGWWVYQTSARLVFGGVPLFAPLIWGGEAAIFYATFVRVRATSLPDRGKLYAMITLSPVIAAAQLIYVLLLGLLIG